MIDLEEHKRLEAEATKATWHIHREDSDSEPEIHWRYGEGNIHSLLLATMADNRMRDADAELIVMMRNDHAEMIRELEEARESLELLFKTTHLHERSVKRLLEQRSELRAQLREQTARKFEERGRFHNAIAWRATGQEARKHDLAGERFHRIAAKIRGKV